MSRPLRFPWLVGGALALGLPALAARAEDLTTSSVRDLAIRAATVVVGKPLDPVHPDQCRVLEVLRGPGLRAGDTLTLVELGPHALESYQEGPPPARKPRPRRIAQVLLFLGPDLGPKGGPSFRPLPSGLRFYTEDGKVLVPEQPVNPGGYVLAVRPGADWAALLRQARADVAAVDRVLALKALPRPGERNRGLLDWAERHRHEFGGGPDSGWGPLETDVFRWVLEGGTPEECWQAVRLYAELNHGSAPPLPAPCFGNRPARDLLLGVALDDRALAGDRARALGLLVDQNTLRPAAQDRVRVEPVGVQERLELLDRLVPLLKAREPPLRSAAARAVKRLSIPEGGALPRGHTQKALAALETAYRAERPGPVRDDLAEAVCAVGGPRHWQEVTGNPPGLLVCLRDLGQGNGQAFFWLNLRPCGLAVRECPTLVLEQLNFIGWPVQTRQMPLPVVNLPRPWGEGWDGGSYLLVQFPVEDLTPGSWRVRVRGTAGKDGARWTSEPKMLVIEAPRKNPPQPPRAYRFEGW
jgi:hypothetical protein